MLISDLGKGMNIDKMELVCSDHRMVQVGRDLNIIYFQPLAMGKDTFQESSLLRVPATLALNTSTIGISTFLGNLLKIQNGS